MHVLIADTGTRPDDFNHADADELVTPAWVCTKGRRGVCSCRRAFVGLRTGKGTTIARVIDADLDVDDFTQAYADSVANLPVGPGEIAIEVRQVLDIARTFPLGSRLRRNRDDVTVDVP